MTAPKHKRTSTFRNILVASAAVASSGAWSADEGAADQGAQLQEIVVTAQRRTERLQDVPISAQVVGSRSLEQKNFNSLDDLTTIIPGVKVLDSGPTSNLYIRGIGSAGNPSFDQSVATFSDDIYHGRARMSLGNFLDLDRIELLKGPQSTFFGNNAIAGAINMVSKKPGDEFEASARALYGMFDTYAFEGAAGGPVSSSVGVRLALAENGTGGWIHDVYTDENTPKSHNQSARLTLVYHPSEDFDATLKIEGGNHATTGAPINNPLQITECPPPAPYTAAGFCSAALAQKVPTYPINDLGTLNAAAAGQGNWLSTFEDVLTVNYHQWNHTLTSVTGFYNYHFSENFNVDQTPANLLAIRSSEKYHQFSQEFRVASATGQRLEYLGGVYFQTDDLDPNPTSLTDTFRFLTPLLAGIPPIAPYLPLGQSESFTQTEHIYSVFGSVTWNVSDHLKLSAGLRGSDVQKTAGVHDFYGTATRDYGGIAPLPAGIVPIASSVLGPLPADFSGERSDHAWMPSGRLQYQFNPQVMGYFSYARGFKAGGFNGTDTTGNFATIPFKPEYVNAYELGLKSELLNNHLLVNVDAFRSNYSDLQTPVSLFTSSGVFVSVVNNAGASRTQGVELETQWVATESFRVAANASYIDAYYLTYPNGPATLAEQFAGAHSRDLSGRPTGVSPPFSASVTASYSRPMTNALNLLVELGPYFSSAYNMADDPLQHQGAYVRLDARLGINSADGHWGIDVIGKNMTDRQIYTSIIGSTIATGTLYVTREEPRNVAVQVRYRY